MEMMEYAWYIRWFRMSEKVWNRFKDQGHRSPSTQTNICTFIRVSTLWLFLATTANLLTWAVMIWLLVVQPAQTYGLLNYFASLGGVLAIVAAIALIAGVSVLGRTIKDKRRAVAEARSIAAEKKAAEGPGFWTVVLAYIKARHDKICVLINIKESRHV